MAKDAQTQGMGFDDDAVESDSPQPKGTARAATDDMKATGRDADGVPYCPVHMCRMLMTSGQGAKGKDYYKCRVPRCPETGQRVRVEERFVPDQPNMCPRCKDADGQTYVAREYSKKRSTNEFAIMACPRCGEESGPIPLPKFAQVMENQRKRGGRMPVAGIGDR